MAHFLWFLFRGTFQLCLALLQERENIPYSGRQKMTEHEIHPPVWSLLYPIYEAMVPSTASPNNNHGLPDTTRFDLTWKTRTFRRLARCTAINNIVHAVARHGCRLRIVFLKRSARFVRCLDLYSFGGRDSFLTSPTRTSQSRSSSASERHPSRTLSPSSCPSQKENVQHLLLRLYQ